MSNALGPSYWEHRHGGSQDHARALLVGTACPCSMVGRSNHHAQKKPSPCSAEWNYSEKLFVSGENALLSRQYSVRAGLHTRFTSHRQAWQASVVGVCPASSQKPLSPCTHTSSKKKVVPVGDLPYRRWQVPLLLTRADIQMTWSVVAGWTSAETSFPHYSQFPFASHRGFELFLSITAKRRLLADVSACYLFHNASPYAWMVLFPFLTTKPVHLLIQLQPFLAGFLTDAQQPILFALRMMRIPAPWILELNFYTGYKGKGTVFFQREYCDRLRCWALILLQKPPFPSEERNAPQHVLSTSQDLTIKSFPEGHRVNQKQCQEFNTASWIHPLLTMNTKPCSVYTEIKQHWSCTIAWLRPICN